MEFIKYMHIERFGTTEVEGIEIGTTYIFPKIDGANSSLWLDNRILQAGSRTKHLTLEKDNAGFFKWANKQQNIIDYLTENPTHRLFGEWLVPHSLKTYRENTWRNFYIFDVAVDRKENEITHDEDSTIKYLHYDTYKPLVEKHGLNYIAPISVITNTNYEQLINQLAKNIYLIENGKGIGEGIVIKNYEFINKYNRQTWAKIVTSEFKEKHSKVMGASEMNGKKMVEDEIAKLYVTTALCEKVKAKIEIDNDGFSSKNISQLLNTIYYDIITEESWNFIKKFKNPIINFKTLQHFVFAEIKTKMPILF